MKTFDQLSLELQLVLNERFQRYNMDAEYMFNDYEIFSDEVKAMSDLDILEFMEHKDISHIYPRSDYPQLASEPTNVFLEDSAINRYRGANFVSEEEIQIAYQDQIQDTIDLDVNEDGIIDLSADYLGSEEFDWLDGADFTLF